MSHPSSLIIGTAYGNWLGVKYMQELQLTGRPLTYGVVDFQVYTGSTSWYPGSIFSLREVDELVGNALSLSEWSRGWRRQRTDVLNADTDEIFEIKPRRARQRGEGPAQLEGYRTRLQLFAPSTDARWGPVRPRFWHGGSWDPSRYPMIVPGPEGQICMIHAWQDPQVQGLLVYDITCCPLTGSRPELRATRVANVVREIEQEMRPGFENMLQAAMPLGEAGQRYAILASTRFFELFVKGAWDRDQLRLYERYGPRPGPALRAFMTETLALAITSPVPAPLGNVIIASSGFVSRDMAASLLGLAAFQTAIGVAAGLAMVAYPGVLAAAAAGATWAVAAGVTAEEAAAMNTGTAIAGNVLPRVATTLPTAGPSLLNGSSALLQIGRTVGPRLVDAGTRVGQLGAGLGVFGAFVYGVLPGEAEAASPGSPDAQAVVAASELPLIVPVELVQPIGGGTIHAGSFVRCGGEKFFIPAIVIADGG
jgi:hypothetical protein